MSLFSDNFEGVSSIPADLTGNGWTVTNSSDIALETGFPKQGSKAIRLAANSRLAYLAGSGNGPSSARIEFWFRFSALPASGSRTICYSYQGNSPNLQLRLKSTGNTEITNASGGVLGTGGTTLSPDTWYRIDWRLLHDNYIFDNEVVLTIDNVEELDLAEGLDTQAISETTVDGFSVNGSGQASEYFYFDDTNFILDTPGGDDISSTSSSSSSSMSSQSDETSSSSSSSTSQSSMSSSSTSSLSSQSSSSSSSTSSLSSSSTSWSSQSTSSSSSSSTSWSSQSTSSSSSVSSYSESSSSSSTSNSSVSSSSSSSSSVSSVSSSSSTSSSSSGTSSNSSSQSSSSTSAATSQSQTSSSSSSSQSLSTSSSSSSLSSQSSSSSTITSESSQSTSSISDSSSSSSSSDSSSGNFGQNLYLQATSTALFMEAWRRRDVQFAIELLDAAGEQIVVDSSNVVVLKIGKDGSTPHLDISSFVATANGSTVSNTNPVIVRLDKEDLKFAPGVYDAEIVVLDDRSGSIVTTVEKGVFILNETMRGITQL